jgi:hypothetical protein
MITAQVDGVDQQQWNVIVRSGRGTLRQSYQIAGDQEVRELTAGQQSFSPI